MPVHVQMKAGNNAETSIFQNKILFSNKTTLPILGTYLCIFFKRDSNLYFYLRNDSPNFVTIYRVSLHCPCSTSKFYRITIQPIFSFNRCGGKDKTSIEFRS